MTLYSLVEVAGKAGVHVSLVRRHCQPQRLGRIDCIKVGNSWAVTEKGLKQFLARETSRARKWRVK